MLAIYGHQGSGNDARRGRRWAEENMWLAAVKLAEDMRGGEQVAVSVDKETVAIEKVVNAVVGSGLIDRVDDGADRVPLNRIIICDLVGEASSDDRPKDTSEDRKRPGSHP
jgi:hypothetical protein